MKKTGDNVDFTVFGADGGGEKSGAGGHKRSPAHMKAEARMALYATVAGLLEGGFAIADAAGLVANEYAAAGMRMEATSVNVFFGGIVDAAAAENPSAEMGTLATKAFGRYFVGPEEMVLLRALPLAKHPAAVLRAAAGIIGMEYRSAAFEAPRAARRG